MRALLKPLLPLSVSDQWLALLHASAADQHLIDVTSFAGGRLKLNLKLLY